MEQWKDVIGYEGRYQVSNEGRVKSLDRKSVCKNGTVKPERGRTMCLKQTPLGYLIIGLRNGKRKRFFSIHRLVALAFLTREGDNLQINHKNGIRSDNNFENLEWVTASENVRHSFDVLKKEVNMGIKNGSAKLSMPIVLYAREKYIPGDPVFGQSALARKFGVTQSAMRRAIIGKTWDKVGWRLKQRIAAIA